MKKGEFYQYLYIKMKLKGISITDELEFELQSFVDRIFDLTFEQAEPLNIRQTDIFRRRFGISSPYSCQTLTVIADEYSIDSETIKNSLVTIEEQIIKYIKAKTTSKTIDLDTLLSDLNISTRTRNRLCRIGVLTIKDVLAFSKYELLKVRGLGINGVIEIDTLMRILGYSLKYDKQSNLEDNVLNTSIKYLNLPRRLQNILFRNEIFTIEELITYSKHDLLEIGGLGFKGIEEIEYALNSLGYQLLIEQKTNEHNIFTQDITLEQLKRIRPFIIEQQEMIDEILLKNSIDNSKHIK